MVSKLAFAGQVGEGPASPQLATQDVSDPGIEHQAFGSRGSRRLRRCLGGKTCATPSAVFGPGSGLMEGQRGLGFRVFRT